jgi:hypothetical protein
MNHGARPWQKEVAILLIAVRIQAGKYVPLVTLFPPWPFTRTSHKSGGWRRAIKQPVAKYEKLQGIAQGRLPDPG